MKYIKFTGLDDNISVIGAGCMRLSSLSQEDLSNFVHTALDHGVNFFDHADIYGRGRSEEVFGELFRNEPGLREKIFLQTKCGIRPGVCFDFSKEHIIEAVNGSLARLHVSHIDSLLLHRPDFLMEPEEIQEAFETLHNEGKVRSFGVSNQNRFQMELMKSAVKFPITANQLQLSAAHTPMIDAGINVNMANDPAVMRDGGTIEYCRLNSIAVQAWSPIQAGFFGGTFLNNPDFQPLNDKLAELAAKYNVTADTIAYAWILRIPGRMQVITGTSKPERIVLAANAADITLTRDEWYAVYMAAGNKLP